MRCTYKTVFYTLGLSHCILNEPASFLCDSHAFASTWSPSKFHAEKFNEKLWPLLPSYLPYIEAFFALFTHISYVLQYCEELLNIHKQNSTQISLVVEKISMLESEFHPDIILNTSHPSLRAQEKRCFSFTTCYTFANIYYSIRRNRNGKIDEKM